MTHLSGQSVREHRLLEKAANAIDKKLTIRSLPGCCTRVPDGKGPGTRRTAPIMPTQGSAQFNSSLAL
jgi:hypothetical protein